MKTFGKENYLDYADAYEESAWIEAPDERIHGFREIQREKWFISQYRFA